MSGSRLNKRPPRQRETIPGDSWVSCSLIQSPHFAELSGERKKKQKLNHLRRLGSPPGSCWVGNHRLLSTWLHRCVARPLHVLLQATSDSFWWAKGRIPGSCRYSTSVSGHVHMPERMCFNTRYQPANRKLASLCIPLFGVECLQCLRYNDTMNRNSTMIQNETMQWYNETEQYNNTKWYKQWYNETIWYNAFTRHPTRALFSNLSACLYIPRSHHG